MKKFLNKKRFVSLLLFGLLVTSQMISGVHPTYANNSKVEEPQVIVKRKYVYVEYPYIGQAPEMYFYSRNGFQGYLTKYKDTGMMAYYKGFVYSGDAYPIPANEHNDNLLAESKTVRLYRNYELFDYIVDIWYDDGIYRGWLWQKNAEAYQNSDGSWDVYYVGTVYKIPSQFLPDKNKEKSE